VDITGKFVFISSGSLAAWWGWRRCANTREHRNIRAQHYAEEPLGLELDEARQQYQ